MASFEEIMNRSASEFKAPEPLPVGVYHCLVDGPPEPGKSSQKGTDYLRFKFKILSAHSGVDPMEAAAQQVVGKIITNDYYITDGATYRLTDMLRDCLDIDVSKNFIECVAEAPGKQLLVELKHDVSPDNKRRFSKVSSTAHV